ncbi:MAG: NAD(P)/FAD-dependent oxidoreductase [Ruminococcaceae bacterium]|nr:NAD(P)/FAD-dependent oxidoreductase [Oscillospiraceae bacterium]
MLISTLDIVKKSVINNEKSIREVNEQMKYDVIIIGAGPGGIFAAYELVQKAPELKIAVFEAGHALNKRKCPIDGDKIKSCISCKSCSIMSGFGGAGAFSDGKYNITNDFGGTLYEYIGKKKALELMRYVDEINLKYGGEGTKLYTTEGTPFKTKCIQNDLHLLEASVRHLGTDINYVVLENVYDYLKDKVKFYFDTAVLSVLDENGTYKIICKDDTYECDYCIISVGRSGSKWMETVCRDLNITTKSNRVDIGVRVELPAAVFAHITDELYESKIVYRTEKYGDKVRTFCMNPKGAVVSENTNGIITVNGHSYEDPAKQTNNTNFALLVAKHFSEPFKDSNGYGESIARLSNMLGGGVIVQRFGDLIRGRRSTQSRIDEAFITPTLSATPGDLSLVLPKRLLDGIIEMIYALDKVAPGTANEDTLLYGVEVKFYNMEVEVDEHLESNHKGLYIIGDGSGITHSLSHASASGVHVARNIANKS